MNIQPVVEGHGELSALPVLLRRLLYDAEVWTVDIGKPILQNRSQLATPEGIAKAVKIALGKPKCGGILVLFDSDDDCPAELGPRTQAWANEASLGVPCAVCMAHREYEAWFLATVHSLREHRAIKADAEPHPNPESPRDAKVELRRRMVGAYNPTIHQAAFSSKLDLAAAFRKCRSFKKLVASVGALMDGMGQRPEAWPPEHWYRTT